LRFFAIDLVKGSAFSVQQYVIYYLLQSFDI